MKTLYFYGQPVEDHGDHWKVRVYRPIFDTYVALNEKLLNAAIKAKVDIWVFTKGGEERLDPRIWKKEGKRMEKVFRIPTQPMVLYQRYVKPYESELDDEDVDVDTTSPLEDTVGTSETPSGVPVVLHDRSFEG